MPDPQWEPKEDRFYFHKSMDEDDKMAPDQPSIIYSDEDIVVKRRSLNRGDREQIIIEKSSPDVKIKKSKNGKVEIIIEGKKVNKK